MQVLSAFVFLRHNREIKFRPAILFFYGQFSIFRTFPSSSRVFANCVPPGPTWWSWNHAAHATCPSTCLYIVRIVMLCVTPLKLHYASTSNLSWTHFTWESNYRVGDHCNSIVDPEWFISDPVTTFQRSGSYTCYRKEVKAHECRWNCWILYTM